jgi:hypothetical protein
VAGGGCSACAQVGEQTLVGGGPTWMALFLGVALGRRRKRSLPA